MNKTKKIIIAGGLIIFLLIIIIISLIQSRSPSSQISGPTPTSIAAQISADPSMPQLSGTGIPGSNVPNWNLYTGAGYSFEYPPDWTAQKNDIEGGGEAVVVKPSILPQGVYYPEFILEKQPFKDGTIERRISIEKVLGLVESRITILNQSVKKLSGTIPFKKYGSETLNEPVQQTTILMTYGGSNYAFIYQYEGSKVNKDLEQYFNDIILGIRFN